MEPVARYLVASSLRLQPPTVPRYNEIPTAPPGMQPKPRWVQSFTASFSELRDLLHEAVVAKQTPLRPMNTPSLGDVDAWELYAMGSEDADTGPGCPSPALHRSCILTSLGATPDCHQVLRALGDAGEAVTSPAQAA